MSVKCEMCEKPAVALHYLVDSSWPEEDKRYKRYLSLMCLECLDNEIQTKIDINSSAENMIEWIEQENVADDIEKVKRVLKN